MPQTLGERTEAVAVREDGSWRGWRDFTIESRNKESDIITSFVLRPVDGGPVLRHQPGQHLTFLFEPEGRAPLKRNYSISTAPNGETYRISVKREPHGASSRWLHDEAKVGMVIKVIQPSGDFVLPEKLERPMVLLSGGVGLTPMVAILETVAERHPDLKTQFVHCTIDGSTHAFGPHVHELDAKHPNIEATTFYSRPKATDVAGRDFDHAKRIDMDWLRANTPIHEANYFVCGPLPFMRTFVTGLVEAGVPVDRVRYEFFGPVEELLEEAPVAAPPSTGTSVTAGPYSGVKNAMIGHDDIGKAILDSASDAVVASDREGFIIMWNPGAERIFGFTEQEALGQSLDIIVPEQFRARHWEGYTETVASGQSRYGAGDLLAVPGMHKDGHRISLEFTIVLMKDAEGRVEGMASVMRDVTKRFMETKALRKQIDELTKAAAG